MSAAKPSAWGLFNVHTARLVGPDLFMKEATARAAAERRSNQWHSLVAVPLFLHPAAAHHQCAGVGS